MNYALIAFFQKLFEGTYVLENKYFVLHDFTLYWFLVFKLCCIQIHIHIDILLSSLVSLNYNIFFWSPFCVIQNIRFRETAFSLLIDLNTLSTVLRCWPFSQKAQSHKGGRLCTQRIEMKGGFNLLPKIREMPGNPENVFELQVRDGGSIWFSPLEDGHILGQPVA